MAILVPLNCGLTRDGLRIPTRMTCFTVAENCLQIENALKWSVTAAGVGVMVSRVVLGGDSFTGQSKYAAAEKALLQTTYKFKEVPEMLAKAPWMGECDGSDSELSDDDSSMMDTETPALTSGNATS